MTGRNGTFGLLIGAAVGTLPLVPVPGSAQGVGSASCGDVALPSPLDDLTRCAEQGFGRAQHFLGVAYGIGDRVPQDHARAEHWFRLAAEQGLAGSQFNLGVMYDRGRGVPEDDGEAVRWFRLAAHNGYALAQYNLGVMYANGDGVPEDRVSALMWVLISAAQGNETARSRKESFEQGMTRERITEAQQRALEWVRANL